MRATEWIRRASLLLIVLATGHALIHGAQTLVFQWQLRTYGVLAFDAAGRVRHWREDERGKITFLSAESVREPGASAAAGPGWQWDAAIVVRAGARPPRPHVGSRYPGGAMHVGNSLHAVQLIDGVKELWIRRDGDGPATFWLFRKLGREMRLQESRRPIEGAFSWPPDILAVRTPESSEFAGVVNDEYWIVDSDGRFIQRDPLPFERSPGDAIEYAHGEGDARMLLLPGGPCHPDSIPLRAVLLRRGHEPLLRRVRLEPVTPEQHRLAATWAILTAFRPIPLNALATKRPASTDAYRMLSSYWLDPHFADGAHTSWLWLNVLVALGSAYVAFRSVRVRCGSSRERAFWIVSAALLGPMGLVWVRMSIPWCAIVNGRAVDRGTWDAPAKRGVEVFA